MKSHHSDCKCSLCGRTEYIYTFKNGYVCDHCIEFLKDGVSFSVTL